jgi:hypothetical protein
LASGNTIENAVTNANQFVLNFWRANPSFQGNAIARRVLKIGRAVRASEQTGLRDSALRYRLPLVDVDFAEAEALEHAGDGAAGIVGGGL